MAIDKEELKLYADLLEAEINRFKDTNKDVRELSEFEGLRKDIADAKAGRVFEPRSSYGLGRWIIDQSDIPEIQPLSNILSNFLLLLEGWRLPSKGAEI